MNELMLIKEALMWLMQVLMITTVGFVLVYGTLLMCWMCIKIVASELKCRR